LSGIDTRTGEMSICAEKTGQLVCRLAADERRAFEESLSDLSARVAALEKRLDMLDAQGKDRTAFPTRRNSIVPRLQWNKMMRRFFGMVEELQQGIR
jgi:anti-sigma-K factor RskA